MLKSRVDSRTDVIVGRADGYWVSTKRQQFYNAEYYNPALYLGSGCLLSSANDLAKWDLALRNGTIFPDTKSDPYSGRTFDTAWGKSEDELGRSVWTGGGLYGYTSSLIRFIDRDLTVIVLTNSADGKADIMARDVLRDGIFPV